MLEDVYEIASNSTRRRVLLSLLEGDKPFSDLMRSVSLDPEHDTGPFLYHVHRLEGMGLLSAGQGRYALSPKGMEIARCLVAFRHALSGVGSKVANGSPSSAPRLPRKKLVESIVGGLGQIQQEGGTHVESSSAIIRILQERDVEDLLGIFYKKESHSGQIEHMRQHLTRVARRGLGEYSNNWVAQVEDRAVGRVIVDTNYPPYSELAGFVVDPKHRDEGIEDDLLSRSLEFAGEKGCNIQYTILDRTDSDAQKLFSGQGFLPAIVGGFHERNLEICMFRFAAGTIPAEFFSRYPLAQIHSDDLGIQNGLAEGRMTWADPLSSSTIALVLKGKRHMAMPRISAITLKDGEVDMYAEIGQTASRIGPEHGGSFKILFENRGERRLSLHLSFILPDATVVEESNNGHIRLMDGERKDLEFTLQMGQDFAVPALGFTTVLANMRIDIVEPKALDSPLILSAGFEMD